MRSGGGDGGGGGGGGGGAVHVWRVRIHPLKLSNIIDLHTAREERTQIT